MVKGELSLHTKVIGDLKIVRANKLPLLIKENVAWDIKRGYYTLQRKLKIKSYVIYILKRTAHGN